MTPRSVEAFKRAIADGDNDYLTSVPDWAPTAAVPRRKARTSDTNYGMSFSLLRWPVLIVLSLWVALLLLLYAIIRLWVTLSEWVWVWRGRRRQMRARLRSSTSYSEWESRAQDLDRYFGFDHWRDDARSAFYDYRSLTKIVAQLRRLQNAKSIEDVEALAVVLESCLKYNFCGVQNQAIYSQCYSGTKRVVDEYTQLLQAGMATLLKSDLPTEAKKILFESFSKQYGRSALCLSGGGSFAYRHFGIVKALLDQGMLPEIVSGTSGGGLVAALVGTRSTEELRELLTPELANHLTACWEKFPQWVFRWLRTGARFDAVDWAEKARFFTLGDLTFKEAYKRTGKILNISTVPADHNSPTVLCNYITSPNCVIWTALLASAAVPGILNPVVLMEKTSRGKFVPYSFGSKWRDGSFRTDVPIQALNTFFNVNFTIVSQVNPHIRLFAYLPRGQVGRPVTHKYSASRWRGGFVLSAVEIALKLEIKKCMMLCKNLDLIPQYLNQDWTTIFLQRFTGSVTIWPKARLIDFWRILADPTVEQFKVLLRTGEVATYPSVPMIRNFIEVERAVEHGLAVVLQPQSSKSPTPLV